MENYLLILIIFIAFLIGRIVSYSIFSVSRKGNIFAKFNCNCGKKVNILNYRCFVCKFKTYDFSFVCEILHIFFYIYIFYFFDEKFIYKILILILFSLLMIITGVDIKIMEIPFTINVIIFIIGILKTLLDIYYNSFNLKGILIEHFLGMLSITSLLLLVDYLTKGQGIGGGDIKLMFSAGLYLGVYNIVFSFIFACLFAIIGHFIVTFFSKKKENMLPFGPYLSLAIILFAIKGDIIVSWYVSTFMKFE